MHERRTVDGSRCALHVNAVATTAPVPGADGGQRRAKQQGRRRNDDTQRTSWRVRTDHTHHHRSLGRRYDRSRECRMTSPAIRVCTEPGLRSRARAPADRGVVEAQIHRGGSCLRCKRALATSRICIVAGGMPRACLLDSTRRASSARDAPAGRTRVSNERCLLFVDNNTGERARMRMSVGAAPGCDATVTSCCCPAPAASGSGS